ncbi:MAG: hypothetical protein SPG50_03735, partial [Muribaculaceae bacterium]|nr:hypothetical protein [Muribaculaceae bacterium]
KTVALAAEDAHRANSATHNNFFIGFRYRVRIYKLSFLHKYRKISGNIEKYRGISKIITKRDLGQNLIFSPKSTLFTPHLGKNQSNFAQIYYFYPTFGQNPLCTIKENMYICKQIWI